MRTTTLLVLALLARTLWAADGGGTLLPWPEGVTVRPARPDHAASGPGAALPAEAGVWLFDAPSHTLVRVGAAGTVSARVPVAGFVHSLTVRADGDLAWVDLARRVVVVASPTGQVRREVRLPAGVAHVRRLLDVDGRLRLHTAYQETLTVPEVPAGQAEAPLRAWFAGKREGLLFDAARPAAQVVVAAGRADLLLGREPQGPTVGKDVLVRVAVRLPEPALAAEVLGPAPGDAWWLRVTFGARDAARDVLAVVTADGALASQAPLPAHGVLSWPDTLFAGPDGGVVGLVPTPAGVVRREWRRP